MSHARHTTALRRGLTALAVLLAGLAAAPTASASSEQVFPVGGPDFQRAFQVAQTYWGAAPCQGQVAFTWTGLEPLTNARATWSNPTDAWNNPAANFDCAIVFNALTQYDFPMLCTVMAHELGHLLGKPHEAQDGLLMSPIYSAALPECGGTPAVPVSSDDEEAAEGVAWSVSQSRARKKKSAKNARATKKSAKRKRCVVRFQGGKRTRRCVVLKRSSRKARAAVAGRTYTSR